MLDAARTLGAPAECDARGERGEENIPSPHACVDACAGGGSIGPQPVNGPACVDGGSRGPPPVSVPAFLQRALPGCRSIARCKTSPKLAASRHEISVPARLLLLSQPPPRPPACGLPSGLPPRLPGLPTASGLPSGLPLSQPWS
jgi:hypothetical protein